MSESQKEREAVLLRIGFDSEMARYLSQFPLDSDAVEFWRWVLEKRLQGIMLARGCSREEAVAFDHEQIRKVDEGVDQLLYLYGGGSYAE